MSESVWFEQVDIALVELIQRTILIDGKPVKVIVRKPDEDFNEEDYPMVSIYNVSDKFSVERYSPEPVVLSRDVESRTLVSEESALPYDLIYQIDFWSTLQSDMNSMTKQWKSFSKRWFNLDVTDESGNHRSCLVVPKGDFGKSDLLSQGKRLYHSFGSYRVQVEIDEKVTNTVPMVTEIVPDANPFSN